jgi:hypothetical protein
MKIKYDKNLESHVKVQAQKMQHGINALEKLEFCLIGNLMHAIEKRNPKKSRYKVTSWVMICNR